MSIIAVGVSWWNRAMLRPLLAQIGDGRVGFLDDVGVARTLARRTAARLVVWASKLDPETELAIRAEGVDLTLIEDGFLRSVGLGAGLARGGAYVLDRSGIYYDASRPSDIEIALETANLRQEEIVRAAALLAAIRKARLSKYNVGGRHPVAWPAGRERVVVVGQVAVDAGVRRTQSATLDVAAADTVNRDLLAAARAEHPCAFIVYKPHPDVAAGLRPGAVAEADTRRLADAVTGVADIVDLIEGADRLVTLSSLSGFEALVRGKAVTVHGLPFYAGWGLTDDRTRSPRRTRQRTLDELAAIALIDYSRYVDPARRMPCTAETMVAALARLKADPMHRALSDVRRRVSWLGRKLGL